MFSVARFGLRVSYLVGVVLLVRCYPEQQKSWVSSTSIHIQTEWLWLMTYSWSPLRRQTDSEVITLSYFNHHVWGRTNEIWDPWFPLHIFTQKKIRLVVKLQRIRGKSTISGENAQIPIPSNKPTYSYGKSPWLMVSPIHGSHLMIFSR